ncbi:MAG: hypothetical protein NTW67_02905 [Candidatus Woesearchaeota archaeon]|nr:hypothetical protein [Candidatus Woesearchaeota archaeon]
MPPLCWFIKFLAQCHYLCYCNDSCYYFVNWSGTGVTAHEVAAPNNASTTINMSENYSVVANFAINTYTLTYSAGTGGSITGTNPQTVNCGADGTAVTAVQSYGYNFVMWSDGKTSNPRTDTNVTGDITVAAVFYYAGIGGGGGGGPQTSTVNINILGGSGTGTTDNNGVLQSALDAASPDGKVAIHIAGGTQALGQNGNPLTPSLASAHIRRLRMVARLSPPLTSSLMELPLTLPYR